MTNFLGLANAVGGTDLSDPHSPSFARHLNQCRNIQSQIYDEIRLPSWLEDLSLDGNLVGEVSALLDRSTVLLKKIVFRIDAPLETSQLAVWHQDYYYVRGNVDIVTAWIPMQDTSYAHGCLQVMPGSHQLGPLPHDVQILDKRHMPSGIFDRVARFVEMKKGDALLFHSCLLHSSGVNFSEVTRYSVQARYSPAGQPTDPAMGGTRSL
jgi:ectoine hydroxylase-related dioxygenase (phytanoyl-CoA dioxygenase family)